MCERFRNLNLKSRRMMVTGNIALALALVLWNFARPARGPGHAWLDGLCGLLFGISIGVNLMAVRARRRCRESQA